MNAMKNQLVVLIFILSFLSNLSSQSELVLSSCDDLLFEINNSTSNDDEPCSRDIILEQVATYSSTEMCQGNQINWVVYIDLWNDGQYDLEYNSSLPLNDTSMDDTNGNSIPDVYVAPTLTNEVLYIELLGIEGAMSDHTVYWRAEDECDAEINCTQEFRVLDTQSPVPYCVSLSTFLFNPSGFDNAEIFAEDFNIGSYDNCTPDDELIFSFSGTSFVPNRFINCDDVINSPVPIDVYFWDNYSNVDYCTVFLSVIPGPTVDCYPFSNSEINGYVKTEDNKPIANAEVKINCALPEYPRSTFTDEAGYYSFNDVPAGEFGCYITAEKEDDYITDVTTLDLVKIMRHILGIEPFTNPYQVIASDVNSNNKVTSSDLLMHRKLILGVISEFPTSPPWVFIDKGHQFSNPDDPWGDLENWNINPYKITLNPNSQAPYDFIGVKVGNIVD